MTKKEAVANIGKQVVYITSSKYGTRFHKCIIKKVNTNRTATINCNVDGQKPGCGDFDIEYKDLITL